MASGSPSRRRQISATASGSAPGSKSGRTVRARSANRRWAGSGRQRLDRADRLAGYAERLAAGGEDAEPRAAGEERLGEVGGGVDDVLAVVEDEQGVRAAREVVDQAGGRVVVARRLALRASRVVSRRPSAETTAPGTASGSSSGASSTSQAGASDRGCRLFRERGSCRCRRGR